MVLTSEEVDASFAEIFIAAKVVAAAVRITIAAESRRIPAVDGRGLDSQAEQWNVVLFRESYVGSDCILRAFQRSLQRRKRDLQIDRVIFRSGLTGVAIEDSVFGEHSPDLSALFGDHRESNIVVIQTEPGNFAESGKRGCKFGECVNVDNF